MVYSKIHPSKLKKVIEQQLERLILERTLNVSKKLLSERARRSVTSCFLLRK